MVSPKSQVLISTRTYWRAQAEYFCCGNQYLLMARKDLAAELMNRKLWAGRGDQLHQITGDLLIKYEALR
jgi:hypothetical protein